LPPIPMLELLARIRRARPRVQCLTNTVAQTLTANVLLAIGAEVSMAQHPDEVAAMSAGADALLINLGTLDSGRQAALESLLRSDLRPKGPVVLDPVFVQLSPMRMALAKRLLALPGVILKGNATELAAMAGLIAPDVIRITTGKIDHVAGLDRTAEITAGHPLMARTTATGCALGAVVAAFASVSENRFDAVVAALTCFGLAGEEAARRSSGPGLFPAHLVDALAALSDRSIEEEPNA